MGTCGCGGDKRTPKFDKKQMLSLIKCQSNIRRWMARTKMREMRTVKMKKVFGEHLDISKDDYNNPQTLFLSEKLGAFDYSD
jgi:hypothetical protein